MNELNEFKQIRNVGVFGDEIAPEFTERLMSDIQNKVVMSWKDDVTKTLVSLKEELKKRQEIIFLADCNDIYEYNEKASKPIEALVVFIKHGDSSVLFDPTLAYLVFRGYNAGIFFVFCFDKCCDYNNEGTLMSCGKRVYFKSKKKSSIENIGETLQKIYQEKKNESLKCLNKLTNERIYISYYMNDSYLLTQFKNKQKGFFYKVDSTSHKIEDLFED